MSRERLVPLAAATPTMLSVARTVDYERVRFRSDRLINGSELTAEGWAGRSVTSAKRGIISIRFTVDLS